MYINQTKIIGWDNRYAENGNELQRCTNKHNTIIIRQIIIINNRFIKIDIIIDKRCSWLMIIYNGLWLLYKSLY